ncbi:MAG: hypothetical protein HON48_14245 [Desulfobacula sp.]|jgi:hypothetical protein|nr:hypothetical protein [Desulfobacula sp.]
MTNRMGPFKFRRKLLYFKGGSSAGDTYDAAYNARMATIAESQQGMADEYYKFWETDYKPMEQAKIKANMDMIPLETAYNTEKMQADRDLLPGQVELGAAQSKSALSLLPGQTDLAMAKNADDLTAIGEKAPVRNAFFKESIDGVNVTDRVNQAGADAAQAFAGSRAVMGRDAARMGINPNSGRFASMTNTNAINRAKSISGARTTARSGAEQEKYARLTNAMGY